MDAALAELTEAGARGVVRRAGLQALQPVADAARQLAPVLRGDLRDSIAVSDKAHGVPASAGKRAFAQAMASGASRQSARAALIAANREAKAGGLSVEVYAGPGRHPQAIFQEFGTYKEPAQPYMRPAWDAGKVRVLNDLKASLGAEIDRAAVRAARKAMRAARKAGG